MCLYYTEFRPALGPAQPPIQLVPWALSLRGKRPGRQADHSLPSTAEVKNGGAILPPIRLHRFGLVWFGLVWFGLVWFISVAPTWSIVKP
jgi:hypothetical protein